MQRAFPRFAFLAALIALVAGGFAFAPATSAAQACGGFPCVIVAPSPDLRVTSIDVDQLAGGKHLIEFWIKNEGSANSNGGMYRIDIQGVGVWWGLMGSISVGQTKYFSFQITSPSTPPGTRNVQACADASGQIAELDESDNCLTTPEVFYYYLLPPVLIGEA